MIAILLTVRSNFLNDYTVQVGLPPMMFCENIGENVFYFYMLASYRRISFCANVFRVVATQNICLISKLFRHVS